MSRSESDGGNDHHQSADEVAMNDRSGGPYADLPVWRRRDGWRDRQARQVCRVEVGPAHHVTQQQVHPDIARGRVHVRRGLVRAGGVVVGVPGIPGLFECRLGGHHCGVPVAVERRHALGPDPLQYRNGQERAVRVDQLQPAAVQFTGAGRTGTAGRHQPIFPDLTSAALSANTTAAAVTCGRMSA